MAKQTVNRPLDPHRVPNMSPEATEMGDTWDALLVKVNAMMNDLYGSGTQSTAGVYAITTGTTAANLAGQGIINLSTIGDYTLSSPIGPGIPVDIVFQSTQGSTASGTSIILFSSASLDGLNFVARSTTSSGATSPHKSLSLISLSTSTWQILANNGFVNNSLIYGSTSSIVLLGLATA